MNGIARTPSRFAPRPRLVAAAALSAAVVGLMAPAIAHGQDDDGKNDNDKVSICHQNGNGDYVLITVSASGAENGHAKHEGDVPPAADGTCPAPAPAPTTPATSSDSKPAGDDTTSATPGKAAPATPSKRGKVLVCHITGNGGYTVINIAQAGWDNGHSKHEGDILLLDGAGTESCEDANRTLVAVLAGDPGVTGVNVASLVPAVPRGSAQGMVTVCHLTRDDGYVKIAVPEAAWVDGYSSHNGDILLSGSATSASCTDALVTLGAVLSGTSISTGIDAASLTPAVPAAQPPLPDTGAEHTMLLLAGALAVLAGFCCLRIGNTRRLA